MAVAAVIGFSIFAAFDAIAELDRLYEQSGLNALIRLTPIRHIGNRGKWAAKSLPFVFGALWLLALAGALGS